MFWVNYTEAALKRPILLQRAPRARPLPALTFLRGEEWHRIVRIAFTFRKGIIIVQFQRTVHAGELAFAGCAPVNEAAAKHRRSRFRNRTSETEERKRKTIMAQLPNHCSSLSLGREMYFLKSRDPSLPG